MPGLTDVRQRVAATLRPGWQAELNDHVIDLAWAADGALLAAAIVSGPVTIWRARRGEPAAALAGHDLGTMSIAWRPDAPILATAGQDGALRLWDGASGHMQQELAGGASWVSQVRWCPVQGGKRPPRLASAAGRTVRFWHADGRLEREYANHPSTVADIQWHKRRNELAIAAYGVLILCNPDRPEDLRVLRWQGSSLVIAWSPDGRKIASRDIRTDPRTDLAVVILDNKAGATFPYLEFGDSDAMEIGDRVLAVGAPFGLTGTVTQGIVSSKGRGLNLNMYEDFIQTDAAINPGNSGGPLISLDGKVIGINSAIKSRSGGFQGVGLAVASNLAKGVVDKLKTDGVVHRGYLGVQIRDLDPDVARRLGIEDHGVVVGEVFADTPAGKAGLKPGDIIVAINGKHIDNGKALQRLIATLPLKKAAEFSLVRDGAALKAPVTIEEQPKDFGTARVPAPRPPSERSEGVSIDKMGLELGPLTPAAAEELGYRKDAKGVVIMRVEPGSLADAAGLRQGMLITRVEKEAVSTPEAARGTDASAATWPKQRSPRRYEVDSARLIW